MNFQVGDRVELKSGGPEMTVTGAGQNGAIQCTWFPTPQAALPSSSYFPAAALKKID